MASYAESPLTKEEQEVYQGKVLRCWPMDRKSRSRFLQDQPYPMRTKHHVLFAAVLLLLAIPSPLLWAEETVAKPAGNGAQYELIGRYDIARLNKILTTELADFTSFPARTWAR